MTESTRTADAPLRQDGVMAAVQPVARPERIAVLDVLRGVALCGILLANVHLFSGYYMANMMGDPVTTSADDVVMWLTHFLVDGKFYSLFSLLFGIGFYIFMERAEAKGAPAVSLFRRRLRWLLLIGVVHAVLVWSGDILAVYALMGFLLIPFRRVRTTALLGWAAALLALPVAIYAVMWATGMSDPLGPPPDTGAAPEPGGFDPVHIMLTGYAGGYLDVLQANTIQLIGRWVDLFVSARFPKVLGMFVIGFWVGRTAIASDLNAHAPLLRRVLLVGLIMGLPANAWVAWNVEQVSYLPGSAAGFGYVLAYAVGVPALALAYAAGIALLARRAGGGVRVGVGGVAGGGVLGIFAPVGRMALTNYLLQSVVCVFIFYGFGLGLFGHTGPARAALIALAIYAAQVAFSRLWLRQYAYGPAEWVWRRLTYRTAVPLRRQRAA